MQVLTKEHMEELLDIHIESSYGKLFAHFFFFQSPGLYSIAGDEINFSLVNDPFLIKKKNSHIQQEALLSLISRQSEELVTYKNCYINDTDEARYLIENNLKDTDTAYIEFQEYVSRDRNYHHLDRYQYLVHYLFEFNYENICFDLNEYNLTFLRGMYIKKIKENKPEPSEISHFINTMKMYERPGGNILISVFDFADYNFLEVLIYLEVIRVVSFKDIRVPNMDYLSFKIETDEKPQGDSISLIGYEIEKTKDETFFVINQKEKINLKKRIKVITFLSLFKSNETLVTKNKIVKELGGKSSFDGIKTRVGKILSPHNLKIQKISIDNKTSYKIIKQ